MSNYPPKAHTIDVLADVARAVAHETAAEHPEDIGIAMSDAIEAAAVTLGVLHKRGVQW